MTIKEVIDTLTEQYRNHETTDLVVQVDNLSNAYDGPVHIVAIDDRQTTDSFQVVLHTQ